MADNVGYTAGAGTTIATDDVGSVHFQKIKLDVGGDGTSIQPAGSIPVYIVSGTGAYLMNDAFIDAVAIGGMMDDVAIVSGTENNVAPIRITAARAAHINWRDSIGYEVLPSDYAVIVSGQSQIWSYHENSSNTLTDVVVKTAPGPGLALHVTDIVISTGGTTALNVLFEQSPSTTVLGPYFLEGVNGRGIALQFTTPKELAGNTALLVTTSGTATAHSIDVLGFVGRA